MHSCFQAHIQFAKPLTPEQERLLLAPFAKDRLADATTYSYFRETKRKILCVASYLQALLDFHPEMTGQLFLDFTPKSFSSKPALFKVGDMAFVKSEKKMGQVTHFYHPCRYGVIVNEQFFSVYSDELSLVNSFCLFLVTDNPPFPSLRLADYNPVPETPYLTKSKGNFVDPTTHHPVPTPFANQALYLLSNKKNIAYFLNRLADNFPKGFIKAFPQKHFLHSFSFQKGDQVRHPSYLIPGIFQGYDPGIWGSVGVNAQIGFSDHPMRLAIEPVHELSRVS